MPKKTEIDFPTASSLKERTATKLRNELLPPALEELKKRIFTAVEKGHFSVTFNARDLVDNDVPISRDATAFLKEEIDSLLKIGGYTWMESTADGRTYSWQ